MFLIVALVFVAATSAHITDFVLVDTKTGRDVMILLPDSAIDLAQHGNKLSIRVDTSSSDETIRLDLDEGAMVRVESKSPVYLAGASGDVVYASNALARIGGHTLKACSVGITSTSRRLDEFRRDDCILLRFETVNSTSKGTHKQVSKSKHTDVKRIPAGSHGILSGQLLQWHKVTIGFSGPPASETGMTVPSPDGLNRAPTPFADYRLDVSFVHEESGNKYMVPGYYAADGNGANTHSVSGSVWVVHFTPPATGKYTWKAKFTQGVAVAIHGGGNPGHFFDGADGSFNVKPSNKKESRDFRSSKGRLTAPGGRYFHFANGKPFIMVGPGSHLNILSYEDFDGTPGDRVPRQTFEPHIADYKLGEGRTFANGRGIGLLGAINYLSDKGVNALTATILDGDEVHPFRFTSNLLQYDTSKLAQWGAIFEHANEKGLVVQIRLQGDDHLFSDHGRLHDERKLLYRELVARFGHNLAIVWDLGQDLASWQIDERSAWLRDLDPYGQSPITLRVDSTTKTSFNITNVDGVSLYSNSLAALQEQTRRWSRSGKLTVTIGELLDEEDPDHDDMRRQALLRNIIAQGTGAQFYMGTPNTGSGLALQDFRSQERLWDISRHALRFFETFDLESFRTCGAGCLEDQKNVIRHLDLTSGSSGASGILPAQQGALLWYNPRTGQKSSTHGGEGGDWVVVMGMVQDP